MIVQIMVFWDVTPYNQADTSISGELAVPSSEVKLVLQSLRSGDNMFLQNVGIRLQGYPVSQHKIPQSDF
jgi:hypothetical protein